MNTPDNITPEQPVIEELRDLLATGEPLFETEREGYRTDHVDETLRTMLAEYDMGIDTLAERLRNTQNELKGRGPVAPVGAPQPVGAPVPVGAPEPVGAPLPVGSVPPVVGSDLAAEELTQARERIESQQATIEQAKQRVAQLEAANRQLTEKLAATEQALKASGEAVKAAEERAAQAEMTDQVKVANHKLEMLIKRSEELSGDMKSNADAFNREQRRLKAAGTREAEKTIEHAKTQAELLLRDARVEAESIRSRARTGTDKP